MPRDGPVTASRFCIVDEDDDVVPAGQVGEICVRGETVMLGYWRRPEETEAAIRDGWMHTGDGGRLDEDGFLHVVDRVKDMIITGGENVYSLEVENALAQHPAVRECIVIGVPSEKWVEQVHAIVIFHHGARATEESLIAHARSLLAGYRFRAVLSFERTISRSLRPIKFLNDKFGRHIGPDALAEFIGGQDITHTFGRTTNSRRCPSPSRRGSFQNELWL